TDQFGNPAPAAGEHASGSTTGLTTSTSLHLDSVVPSGDVPAGSSVTTTGTETHTGTTSLTGVSVTGGGVCTGLFTGGASTLAAGASTTFTSTVVAAPGPFPTRRASDLTDQFGNPAPAAGEHASGSTTGLTTSTSLHLDSVVP